MYANLSEDDQHRCSDSDEEINEMGVVFDAPVTVTISVFLLLEHSVLHFEESGGFVDTEELAEVLVSGTKIGGSSPCEQKKKKKN